jgi:hypothetical protein
VGAEPWAAGTFFYYCITTWTCFTFDKSGGRHVVGCARIAGAETARLSMRARVSTEAQPISRC